MTFSVQEIFPGLEETIPADRFLRVCHAVDGLFNRTITRLENNAPFIITGDIPAMWLRDSTWQVKPLFYSHDLEIINLLIELSKLQVQLFLKDPFANAFNPTPNGNCWHKDFPDQSPWVFERKFELDSWALILHLARMITQTYGRNDHVNDAFKEALTLMVTLAIQEQNHDSHTYRFARDNRIAHDSLSHDGYGAPVGHTGMVYSAFRPSDDACKYGYLIPSNLFFLNELRSISQALKISESRKLCADIQDGINKFALFNGRYAYEVDGLGNALFMDDANVPSLLSLPYLGALSDSDPIYLATRNFVLSKENPYFFTGRRAIGVGSQHTPTNHIWPIALAMEALTSSSSSRKLEVLHLLETTDAATGQMHESFHADDENIFTRAWFSWADMTYVELVLQSVNYNFQN